MKKAEGICSLIGSLVGAIGTGVAIYFTGSVWCSIIGFLGFMIGRFSISGKYCFHPI